MKKSDNIGQLAAALAAAQGEFKPVIKDKTAKVQTTKGYSYTYDYADLDSIIEAVKQALAKHQIAVIQNTTNEGSKVSTTTFLAHASGEWIETDPIVMVAADDKAQSTGSAATYSRRYSIQSALRIAAESDEDGNLANGHNATTGPKHAEQGKPEAEAVLAQTDLWNRIRDNHGEGAGLEAWVRKALGNPTRSRNKLGKWGFTEAEFLLLKKTYETDEKALKEGEEALK